MKTRTVGSIILIILVGLSVNYLLFTLKPCPSETVNGVDCPMPSLGCSSHSVFGNRVLAISEINDPAAHTAKVYLYKDGELQNQQGETRHLLWFQENRVLLYLLPPEENAAYELWVKVRNKEFLYWYRTVPASEPFFSVYRLSGEPVFESQPGGGRELVPAEGDGGT